MRQLLDHVDHCLVWKLVELPALPSWVSKNGNVVVMGDAAHAMLPFAAQGGVMDIEDGAALAECLDRARDINEIRKSMRMFEFGSLEQRRLQHIHVKV